MAPGEGHFAVGIGCAVGVVLFGRSYEMRAVICMGIFLIFCKIHWVRYVISFLPPFFPPSRLSLFLSLPPRPPFSALPGPMLLFF